MNSRPFKIPRSVLVVIHTPQWEVLLLRRQLESPIGTPFWQSVTGSQEMADGSWADTAVREVQEETGIVCAPRMPNAGLHDWNLENVYPIYPQWRSRYAPDVFFNVERVFGVCLDSAQEVRLSAEHASQCWLPWRDAADLCFSASNAEAILNLPHIYATTASGGN